MPARPDRGPRPPDTTIAALVAGVIGAAAAWDVLVALARRGVLQALPAEADAAIRAATAIPDMPPEFAEEIATARRLAISPEGHKAEVAGLVLFTFGWLVRFFAEAGGSRGYIWRTQRDEKVRQLHADLHNTFHRWDTRPISGTDGFRGHPGEPGGCRCIAYPIL